MSDEEDREHDARVEAAVDKARKINARRRQRVLMGEPGDPPHYVCENCLREGECAKWCRYSSDKED